MAGNFVAENTCCQAPLRGPTASLFPPSVIRGPSFPLPPAATNPNRRQPANHTKFREPVLGVWAVPPLSPFAWSAYFAVSASSPFRLS